MLRKMGFIHLNATLLLQRTDKSLWSGAIIHTQKGGAMDHLKELNNFQKLKSHAFK